MTLAWCVKTMGYKKYKGTPTLRVSLAKVESEDCYGYQCPYLNEIVLYKETLKDYTVRKLIMVIIHEYTHSLQKVRKSYGKMYDKFGYWKHPMEIEARMSESTWNICYKDIKGDLLKQGEHNSGVITPIIYPPDTMSYVDNSIVRGKYVENFSLKYLEMSKCQSRFRHYTIPLKGYGSPTFSHPYVILW